MIKDGSSMKKHIKGSYKYQDELLEYISPKYYNDVDNERLKQIKQIDWTDIPVEDVEYIVKDPIDLNDVVSVRYFDEYENSEAAKLGYEGGYVFTYSSGAQKKFAWLPYPEHERPLEEIDVVC